LLRADRDGSMTSGMPKKVADLRPGGWYTHQLPPRLQQQLGASTDETQGEGSATRSRGSGELVLLRRPPLRYRP
jgi:hypothetical protein